MLTSGQLAATAGSLFPSSNPPDGGTFTAVFANTSASAPETVTLTLTATGGTARRLAKVVLQPSEQLVVANLKLLASDTFSGAASDAATVDYAAFASAGAFEVYTLDANGGRKVTAATTSLGAALNASVGASTAAAGTTTADATVLPAATAFTYPTTAADDTKGVRINAADQVTGRAFFVGNGVSNKILKVYAPSGGVINGAAGDAAYSTASGKGALVVCLSGTGNTWLALG